MPRFAPHPDRRPALVTGASSGIGRATAVALAEAGHPVVLGARRVERCAATAQEICDAGGEAVALAVDMCDTASIAAFAAAATAAMGPIEVVVSNAGEVQPLVVTADPSDFARQIGVNLLGPQCLLHELVPAMVERRRGDVVVVTSEVSQRPRPNMAGYVAAKAGLEAMVDALRMELEGSGVRVGVVRPGPATTEQGSTWTADDIHTTVSAWQRWGFLRHDGALRPEQVAGAICAVVTAPRGSQLTHVEVQPEAPVDPPAEEDQ
ncbi:MAG: SDR family oxidoreductase [Acidimicrobiia bacterium]|nr:SDR family oxidoreductase [Acidimicrobiia bacterium]